MIIIILMTNKLQKYSSPIGKSWIFLSTLISASFLLCMIVIMFFTGWESVSLKGLELFSLTWKPSAGDFGILPMLYGTLAATSIALIVALSIGLPAAIYTSEILSSRYRLYVKSLLELLAGVPSVVYGLIGITFLTVWVGDFFELQSGRTILVAGLLLGLMILPTFITLVDDALKNVPNSYRETSLSLGLFRYEMILRSILPIAKADIIGAMLLSFGRAMGETMAVTLVIGSMDKIPQPFYDVLNAGQTVTSKLGREIAESDFGSPHFSAMIFMAFLLLTANVLITWIAHYFFNPEQRLYE